MLTVEFEQIEIDYCRKCGGVWLDSGEAELIGEKAGVLRPGLLAALDAGLSGECEPGQRRDCPVCGKLMARFRPAELAPVCVDRCCYRHGLWFDRGELQQVIGLAGGGKDSALSRFLAGLEEQRRRQTPIHHGDTETLRTDG
jgi:Zn-finger nucleic acid-binding protein